MKQTLKILGTCLAIFAVYLPVALRAGRDFKPLAPPDGEAVEMLFKFEHVEGSTYRTRTFIFYDRPFALYENTTPLGAAQSRVVEFRPPSWRFIDFATSDGSDPNTNGRRYWAVIPGGL